MKTRQSVRNRQKCKASVATAASLLRSARDSTAAKYSTPKHTPKASAAKATGAGRKRKAPVVAPESDGESDQNGEDDEEIGEPKPPVVVASKAARKRRTPQVQADVILEGPNGDGPSTASDVQPKRAPTRKRNAEAAELPSSAPPPHAASSSGAAKKRKRDTASGAVHPAHAISPPTNAQLAAGIAPQALVPADGGVHYRRPTIDVAPLGGDGRAIDSISVTRLQSQKDAPLVGKKRREEEIRAKKAAEMVAKAVPSMPSRLHFDPDDQRACCTGCASLAIFDAIRTSNLQVIESLVADKKGVSTVNPRLAPDAFVYALTMAIRGGDLPVVRALTATGIDQGRSPVPQNSIARENDTGAVGMNTYSHRVRKVNVARGGKEGNTALIDTSRGDPWEPPADVTQQAFRRAVQTLPDTDAALQCVEYLLLASHTNFKRYVEYYGVYDACESGNKRLLSHLVRAIGGGGPEGPLMNSSSGFNRLHVEVLSDSPLSPYKRISVPKKATSNNAITPVHFAAINPNPSYIRELFATLNSNDGDTLTDRRGRRAVHFAAACDGVGPLEYLLSRNNDLGKADQAGILPIHLCAKHGKVHNIAVFARFYGGSLAAINDRGGKNACHYAAHYGHAATLAELVKYGSPFDSAEKDKKITPLMEASRMGNVACVAVLLAAGANINGRDKAQRTALHWAAKNGHSDIVVRLLRQGSDPDGGDSSGNGPLHYAAAFGHLATVELLVSYGGASPASLSAWKTSPLSIAFIKGHMRVVDYLLRQPGSRLDLRDTEGRSLLHHALLASGTAGADATNGGDGNDGNETTIRQVEFLLTRGASPAIADSVQDTPLHVLAWCASDKAAKATTVAVGGGGGSGSSDAAETVADEPVVHWTLRAAKMLVDAGATLDACNSEGKTPLMIAIESGSHRLAEWFLRRGASIRGRQSGGVNALHSIVHAAATHDVGPLWAAASSRDAAELEACAAAVDKNGFTPLLLALLTANPAKTAPDAKADVGGVKAGVVASTLMDVEKLRVFTTEYIDKCKPNLNCAVIALSESNEKAEPVPVGAAPAVVGGDSGGAASKEVEDEGKGKGAMDTEGDGDHHEDERDGENAGNKDASEKAAFTTGEEDADKSGEEDANKSGEEADDNGERAADVVMKDADPAAGTSASAGGAGVVISSVAAAATGAVGDAAKPPPEHVGRTALHFAAYRATCAAIVAVLCARGADANRRDARGLTPIAQAVFSGSHENVKALLDGGADPNGCVCGNARRTPLMVAASKGTTRAVRILLEAGADASAVDENGQTALILAVLQGLKDNRQGFAVERAIVAYGGDVNTKDKSGCAVLHYAFRPSEFEKTSSVAMALRGFHGSFKARDANAPNADPIETIIDLCSLDGMDVNARDWRGRTALHYAAECGAVISTMYLLQHGADINATDALGNGPLQLALANGHTSYAAVLINKGADIRPHVTVTVEGAGDNSGGQAPKSLSTFEFVITKEMMGICYLLMDLGIDLLHATRDALSCAKFQVVVAVLDKKPPAAARAVDANGRGMFHILASCNFLGRSSNNSPDVSRDFSEMYAPQICAALEEREVDVFAKDNRGRTALHAAAASGYTELCEYFIRRGLTLTDEDEKGRSVLAHALASKRDTHGTVRALIARGADVNALGRGSAPSLLLAVRKNDLPTVRTLVDAGANPNLKSPLDGRTALLEAASLDRLDAAKLLIDMSQQGAAALALQFGAVDNCGRTALHWAVKGHDAHVTHEDTDLLRTLASAGVPIDVRDMDGNSAADYAKLQASGKMLTCLRELGATGADAVPSADILGRISAASDALFASAPALGHVDVVADSRAEKSRQEAERVEAYRRALSTASGEVNPVDPLSGLRLTGKVVVGGDGAPLDATLHKVDVRMGYHGQNDFYRMQVIHVTTQDLFILWTRWGRVGETGMHQRTPFGTAQEAEIEFGKVFRSKTGNTWQSRDTSDPKDGKYARVATSDMTDAGAQAAKNDGPLNKFPKKAIALPTSLDARVVKLLRIVSNRKAIVNATHNERAFVLGKVTDENITDAFGVLKEISVVVDQCAAADAALDLASITACREKMVQLGQRFYSIIRHNAWELGSAWTRARVAEKAAMLIRMSDLQAGMKIHLGAEYRSSDTNPYEYCYRALGCDIVPLNSGPERDLVERYFALSAGDSPSVEIADVFAVRRRGEADRFAPHATEPNQMLLWHGSPVSNYLGLLSEGLCIAPPNVPISGAMFGSGIYFADAFAKSAGYMRMGNGGNQETSNHGVALLCRVALGDYIEAASVDTNIAPVAMDRPSTKGVGDMQPHPRNAVVTVVDGTTVPLGPVVKVDRAASVPRWGNYALNYNEFVVYDQNRVNIRYAVLFRSKNYKPKKKAQ